MYACNNSFSVGKRQPLFWLVQSCEADLPPTAALTKSVALAEEKVIVASPVPVALVKVPLAAGLPVGVVVRIVVPAIVVTTVNVCPLFV